MKTNKEVEKVKALISNMDIKDQKVRIKIENLKGVFQKDKDEIISLLKEKRPTLYSNWTLEIASSCM